MARIACPTCSQQLNVPEAARAIRCPACQSRIDLPLAPEPVPPPPSSRPKTRDDEDREPPRRATTRRRDDDEGDREPPRRRKKPACRDDGPTRGLILLGMFGPAILVLMIWAPFSGYGTALGMLVGATAMLFGLVAIVRVYFRDPVLRERVGDPNGHEAHIRMLGDSFPAAFAHPRRIAGYVTVNTLGFLVLVEAMCTAAFLKTMDEPPPGAGPSQPGQTTGPNQPLPKPLSDDEVITKAIADLDSKIAGVPWKALDALAAVKPNQPRAEVLQRVSPLLDASHDGITRSGAVKVIGTWGGPDEVPVLLGLISRRDSGLREDAIRQVARFRDPRATPVLIAVMGDYDEAQQALVELGPAVEPTLLPYLGVEADYHGQRPALRILKAVGTPACVPALRALVRLNDGIRSRAAQEALDAVTARARKEQTTP